ncbi:hypothetical protein [Gloeothece verrucosa]|uniref:Riboflavin kinase n=1 Tax=Gloeothece verrucosa (strain PCC 7822) TaxID=497965 RepID=E0UJE9_GLOV7|nr:hypothetical protein [Gloeothece verrucosa]ADN16967.1 conserved hypothetical protein [Gloeothece verrucosa PCC 7822]
MINAQWITLEGVVKEGHKVASGMAKDSPYPQGTIEMQLPFFKALGLDLTDFFPGTLNVSIYPHYFTLKNPQYTFKQVKWNPDYPSEDFSFCECRVYFENLHYHALIYYPHPETKIGHFQDRYTVEILAPLIPKIEYGDQIILQVNLLEIALEK